MDRNVSSAEASRMPGGARGERPHFSLRALLLITVGAAVYSAMAVAVARNQGKLLDAVMDWAEIAVLGGALIAATGFSLMVLNIIHSRSGYLWPALLLAAAITYAPANLVVFIATLAAFNFAVFEDIYLISVVLAAPAVVLLALILFVGFFRRIGLLGVLGFTLWIASIAFAHLFVIAAAAQSI